MKSMVFAVALTAASLGCWFDGALAFADTSQQQPAAAPSPLRTPYTTERDWAIRQITTDIQEMAGKSGPITWNVAALTPWSPNERMVAFAASQIGGGGIAADETLREQYAALLHARSADLFAASEDVSRALARQMRNPGAHEAAAIVLGAFGLQEAADDLSDHRWVMNRMTAHLAVAAALRGPGGMAGLDGQLARAMLATLSDRQTVAIEMITRLGDPQANTPVAAWQRALLLRITQDWRLLKAPSTATRREKLEYFRARRETVPDRRAGVELQDLKEADAADFARIAHSSVNSVEDGNQFLADSVVRELAELATLYQREFRQTLPRVLPASINDRAGRLMTGGAARVLPWGAWAEFSQRHIAMAVADTDRHYRRTLGMPERADALNEAIDGVLEDLRMFSIGATGRRVGSKAIEADTTYFRDAIDVLATAPELVTFNYWQFFETAAAHEGMAGRVPGLRSWFIETSGEAPYEARHRAKDANWMPLHVHRGLVEAAPHAVWILWTATARQPRDAALSARANTLIADRVGFDLWAIDREAGRSDARAHWEKHLRRGCELSPGRCLTLAGRLAPLDEQAAAAEYERALNDPALDRVTAANSSEWLVFYYERNNEPQRARALAETAAKAFSHRGLRTVARLLERRGEIEEAGKYFDTIATRYPTATYTLAGFLYRRAIVHRDARFMPRWEEIRQRVFPTGLVPETTSAAQPAAGVFVSRDSELSRGVRLQTGDIIIGVDGWRVDNLDQLNTVMAFGDQLNTHKMTAWRGTLFTVSVPNAHGMTLDSYPLKGWVP